MNNAGMACLRSSQGRAEVGVDIAQYEKLRDEAVARMGWHQDLVRYVLIVAGSLPAVLSQAVRDFIGSETLPFALLGGPVVALFILGSMLKHYVYMNLIGAFINSELGGELVPFRPWGAYLTRQLYSTWPRKILLSVFIGAWEFLVPLAVAVLYLGVSWRSAQQVLPTHQARVLYSVLFHSGVILLVIASGVLVFFWAWLTRLIASSAGTRW